MIEIRPAAERGVTERDWLKSYHSFSFGDYQDPKQTRFGPIRVLNDDVVAAGAGFPTHPHRDMEILTYVLSGQVEHRDSEGNHGLVRPFELQLMRAGTGIHHSEGNPSPTGPLRLLQIWIFPDRTGLPPAYQQAAFPHEERDGRLRLVASPDGRDRSLAIDQDATMFVAHLDPGQTVAHALSSGRGAYLHVATGAVEANGTRLREGDGAKLTGESSLGVVATEPTELVLFDVAV